MAFGDGNQKFKFTWKLAFFIAGCLTTAAGVLSFLSFVLSFTIDPFNWVNSLFLLAFGLVMVALDIPPIQSPGIASKLAIARMQIYSNFLFMTRFFGRGIWYLFLGTMVFFSLWENDVSPFLGFFFAGYIIILSGVSIFFSIQLSMKLDKVRKKLFEDLKNNRPHWGNVGLTKATFLRMCEEQAQQKFTDDEWIYIHNAVELRPLAHLSSGEQGNKVDSEEKISKESVESWVQGGMTLV